jgi:hypothetical protein
LIQTVRSVPTAGALPAWWEGRSFVVAMILVAFVPLFYPPVPPLADMMGHMARYRIAAELPNNPTLQQWYEFRWLPIGNLGVDLLIVPLAKLIGVEPATKFIVMLIPPLTVAGFLAVAQEVHGRLPPTAGFALPLAFGHHFMFGFVNFALSMGLALLALAYWIRLGRQDQRRLRAILFLPIGVLIYFIHVFGWGMLGLMCLGVEIARRRGEQQGWAMALAGSARDVSVLAVPLLCLIGWRGSSGGGDTGDWLRFDTKGSALARIFRDRWKWFDILSLAVIIRMAVMPFFNEKLELSRRLTAAAILLGLCFLAMPRLLFGSAFADMRIVPFAVALFLLAIRVKPATDQRWAQGIALAAVAFVLVRIAGSTVSLAMEADRQGLQLEAIDHIQPGSRVATLVWDECAIWRLNRSNHLGSMATIRKDAFANDQWPLAGANMLTVHNLPAGAFRFDPSQIVRDDSCPQEGWTLAEALFVLPRDSFDYLWLINSPPASNAMLQGWTPVWQGHESRLLGRADAATGAGR